MSEYKLAREEMETVIRGNAAGREWEIVTADPRTIRKMAKQGYQPDKRQNPWGYVSFTIPFDKVKIGKAEKSKRGFAMKKSVALHNNASAESDVLKPMVG